MNDFKREIEWRNEEGMRTIDWLHSISKYECFNPEDENNLVKIFFHEIIIFLTGHLIWRDQEEHLDNALLQSDDTPLPYVSKSLWKEPNLNDISAPFRVSMISLAKQTLINICATAWFILKNKTIVGPILFFSSNSMAQVSKLDFIRLASKNRMKVKFFAGRRLPLVNLEAQLRGLEKQLEIWFKANDFSFPHERASLLVKHISSYCIEASDQIVKSPRSPDSLAVVWSQARLRVRMDAVHWKKQGGRLVLIQHGNQHNYILDDPIIGYSESSFCDFTLGYGSLDIPFGKLNNPTTSPNPKRLTRSSGEVIDCFRSTKDSMDFKEIDWASAKVLYIPTALSLNRSYLPFREIGDSRYLAWWQYLAKTIPNLKVKSHPKQMSSPQTKGIEFVSGDLLENAKQYDVLIFDFVSTALANVSLLPVHILYLDIGMQNLSPEVVSILKLRGHYVDNCDFSIDVLSQLEQQKFQGKDRLSYASNLSIANKNHYSSDAYDEYDDTMSQLRQILLDKDLEIAAKASQ